MRACAAVVVLSAALTAACSVGGEPAEARDPSTRPTTAAATAASGGTDLSVGSAPAGAASPTAPANTSPSVTPPGAVAPFALPTSFVASDKVVRDPDLGHEIKVLRVARDLPWPPAQTDEARSLELVAVEMTWTPSVTYTATLRTVDFSLGTSSAYPNRPDAILGPTLQAAGWTQLPAEMASGTSGTGWIVFRVEPRGATALRLDYTRPASRVTDSGQVFPKTVFSAQLTG